jgi:uncharacterized protein
MSNSSETKFRSVGTVQTETAGAYVRKLCKHWSHKLQVRYDEQSGEINFPMGYCELDARQPGKLLIYPVAADAAALQTIQQVVGSHLQRFATRETLTIEWDAHVASA